jgi:RimJ/RimL family protein N-acetyltransferase
MLDQLIELAKQEFNAHLLSLAVFEHNQAAKHCYLGLGFQVIAKEENLRSFGGEPWNLLFMEKSLNKTE